MKKSTLFYGAGLLAYVLISKSLKNKDSSLSICVKDCTEKISSLLSKYLESKSLSKEDSIDRKNINSDEKINKTIHEKSGATSDGLLGNRP